jgi:KDO2-lipid IV(A) lauroyltransferase
MASAAAPSESGAVRCGIDTVDIGRVERLLRETPAEGIARWFSPRELADAGEDAGRAASLAARLAAKEACAKLFARELALGTLEPGDFSVERDGYGAPRVTVNARARAALDRHRIRDIALSLSHDRNSASAVALALPQRATAPLSGRLLYRMLPYRRQVIVDNLRRVFGDSVPDGELRVLAQAHYAHLGHLLSEFLRFRFMTRRRKEAMVRVEGVDILAAALAQGRGVLILTGHFGNFEVSTVAGLAGFPHMRGRIHFVRRAIKPRWLDAWLNRRFRAAGFGVLGKRGSLDAMLERLAAGDVIVFPFDQHAAPPEGIESEFFGHPAWTFKSLAVIALATGAPVLPAAAWREPDGRHVLRFEPPLDLSASADAGDEIRHATRTFNAALERLVLRHPEQWYWVHRRWKRAARRRRRAPGGAAAAGL